MARTRKTTAKKTSAPEVEKTVEFSYDRRVTVSVGTAANYGQAKVGLSLSENVKSDDDPMEVIDSIFDDLTEKLEKKFDILAQEVGLGDEEETDPPEDDEEGDEEWEEDDSTDSDGEEGDDGDDDEDGEEDEEEDESDQEDFTEEEILKMKKAELVELIEDEELDVDIKGMKIKEIREAVVDAYFEDDDGDEDADEDAEDSESDDEEWDDEEWEDDEDEDED